MVALLVAYDAGGPLGVGLVSTTRSLLIASIGIQRSLVLTGLSLPLVAVVGWPLIRRLDAEGVVPPRLAELLRGIPLFAVMPLAVLERVATGMHARAFTQGEPLMVQGEPGDSYLAVETGSVEVRIDGRPHHREGPGCGLGEIALLREVPRTATVIALEPVAA